MESAKIQFRNIPWDKPKPKVLQKIYVKEGQQIRLLRFEAGFTEESWCTRGHQGFVLKGAMDVNFNGSFVQYKEGDGIWIKSGESSKHKVAIATDNFVELLLFESAG